MIEELPSELQLSCETRGDRLVIRICGDIDSSTAPQLRALVDTATEDTRVIEFDMAELRFMDSTGLGVIATTVEALTHLDGRLVLRDVPDLVDRLLMISDLRQFVEIESAE